MANKLFSIQNTYVPKLTTFTYLDISRKSDNAYGKLQKTGRTYQVTASKDVKAVKNAMNNLFKFIPGERVLDPLFGNSILNHLYKGINKYTEEQIVAEAQKMVSTYEPRAKIDSIVNISTIEDTENNTIQLKIVWHVIGLDEQKYTIITGI